VGPGFYVYVGSALGPGGVAGRLRHHERASAPPHWHVDYLRAHARLGEVWYAYGRRRREHAWATLMSGLAGASVPLRGFGASDCGCESHLYRFAKRPSADAFRRQLSAVEPRCPPLHQSVLEKRGRPGSSAVR
jgi:Uri superfamily endonuclease